MPDLFALSLCLVWPSSLARSRASRQPSTCSPSDLLPPGAGAICPRESGRWFVSNRQQCTFWLFSLGVSAPTSRASPPNWPRASRGPPAFQARSRRDILSTVIHVIVRRGNCDFPLRDVFVWKCVSLQLRSSGRRRVHTPEACQVHLVLLPDTGYTCSRSRPCTECSSL